MTTDRGCDNCYYSYFDGKAYPCSLCIRGITREDKWQPSLKTKEDVERREAWKGADDEYERAVEQMEHDMLYEPTYNPEDGSM